MPFSATLIEPYKAPAPSQVTEVKTEPHWRVKVMVLGHDWNTRTQFAEYATNSKVPRFGDCNYRMQFYGHEVSIDLRVRQDSFEESFGKATYRGHDAVIYTVHDGIRKTLDKIPDIQEMLKNADALEQATEVIAVKLTENCSFRTSYLKSIMDNCQIKNYISFIDAKSTSPQQKELFKLLFTEIFEKQITTISKNAPALNIEKIQFNIAMDRFNQNLNYMKKSLTYKTLNKQEELKIQTALDSADILLSELRTQEEKNLITDYKAFTQLFLAADTFFKNPSVETLRNLTKHTRNYSMQIIAATSLSLFAGTLARMGATLLGIENNTVSVGAACVTSAVTYFGSRYAANQLFQNKADQFIHAVENVESSIIKKIMPQ